MSLEELCSGLNEGSEQWGTICSETAAYAKAFVP